MSGKPAQIQKRQGVFETSWGVALWMAAAVIYFNMPNFPMKGGWFFNPFSWNLMFTIGLLTGLYACGLIAFVGWQLWLPREFAPLALAESRGVVPG